MYRVHCATPQHHRSPEGGEIPSVYRLVGRVAIFAPAQVYVVANIDWLAQMRASGIQQFLAFARSVERDKAAIIAGLTLPYSTGPVEGHIHKLKLIKRQAYGKVSLDYLQQRFLVSVDTA